MYTSSSGQFREYANRSPLELDQCSTFDWKEPDRSVFSSAASHPWPASASAGSVWSKSNDSITPPSTLSQKRKVGRKTFFNNGRDSNFCFFLTFILAVLFFAAQFNEIQMDSEVVLLDLHTVCPSLILRLLPRMIAQAKWISTLAFAVHVFGLWRMETRVIFPDLLGIGAWLAMVLCQHWPGRDCADLFMFRLFVASILCIVTTSVAFLPRKKKHRKRPNTILSAFSVASTPVSQCTTLDSSSLLEESTEKPENRIKKRQRESTPSQELGFNLESLSLGFDEDDNRKIRKRRGPFSSIKYNPSVVSRLGGGQNIATTVAPSSVAPSKLRSLVRPDSVFTSISQQSSRSNDQIMTYFCVAIIFSLVANCAMFAFMYYGR